MGSILRTTQNLTTSSLQCPQGKRGPWGPSVCGVHETQKFPKLETKLNQNQEKVCYASHGRCWALLICSSVMRKVLPLCRLLESLYTQLNLLDATKNLCPQELCVLPLVLGDTPAKRMYLHHFCNSNPDTPLPGNHLIK